MRLLKTTLAAALVGVMTFACSSDGGDSRTVEVDYRSDDFAALYAGYFPREITVTPGMTVKFHQTWTGEPHTVSMGKIVDRGYKPLKKYLDGTLPLPDDTPAEYDAEIWEETLPFLFGEEGINQSAALPCYVPKQSDWPKDLADPCPSKFRTQPEFDGTHDYYSSGFIPFEGDLANEFEMKIAEDTPDGTYAYYCNLHHVLMSGEITVKRGAKVESQASMNRRGAEEAAELITKSRAIWEKEKAGEGKYPLPLAGSGDETTEDNVMANIVEFTPRTIDARVGEKVTWTFITDHTITFNVPPYTPLFQYDKKGFLEFNESLDRPRGGWPGPPEDPPTEGDEEPPPRAPFNADAGEWDGSGGIHSSGTGWSTGDTFSITFTKAGTYPYACLIHPGQIGKVVVK